MPRSGILLAALLAMIPAASRTVPVAAQQAPGVPPGGVAALVVTVETGPDTVAYRVSPMVGVRLFAPASGTLAAAPGDPGLLPLTFGLPAQAAAGPFTVATVSLEWPDGRSETRELAVEVLARRAASFWVGSESLTAAAGTSTQLPYGVRNLGNATDTFRIALAAPSSWTVAGGQATLVLGPGEQAAGAFGAAVPTTAGAGEEYLLRATLEATEIRETRTSRLFVVMPESRIGGLATVPGALFLGSTTSADRLLPDMALTAAGEVRPGLRLSLALRHSDEPSPPQAFAGALSGPRYRVGLTADTWSAQAGDLFTLSDLVSGPVAQGRGVEASFSPGAWRAEVFLARPSSYLGDVHDGHVARATVGVPTAYGTFGLRAASVARGADLGAAYRQRGGALTYGLRTGGHELQAEAGFLSVAADSVEGPAGRAGATGAAAEVRYAFTTDRLSLGARLRRVPGTTAGTASHGDETFAHGSYGLTETVRLTGSAYATDAERVDGRPYGRSEGGGLGLRWGLPGGLSASVMGAYRASALVGAGAGGSETRLVRLSGDLPVGPVMVEADADVGLTGNDFGSRRYGTARVGARWSRQGQWGWLGLSHNDFGFGSARTGLDASGSVRFRGAEVQGGLNTPLTGAERLRSASFWSSVEVPVLATTSLSLGAEYRGLRPSPWRLSLGVRQTFGMPVPLPRAPVVRGVIFEDIDGDGARGTGEPGLPGIGVSFGSLMTTTDEHGRFRFYDDGGGPLRVDPSDLPLGVSVGDGAELEGGVVPGTGGVAGRGRAEIAVVRTASLELRVFLDRDGDGTEDPGEEAAVGSLVSLVDAAGTTRDALTDAAGRVGFSGLRPGGYRVRIIRTNARGGQTLDIDLVLTPGANERRTVAAPFRSLEIRMPDGARLDPSSLDVLTAAPAGEASTAAIGAHGDAGSRAQFPRRPEQPQTEDAADPADDAGSRAQFPRWPEQVADSAHLTIGTGPAHGDSGEADPAGQAGRDDAGGAPPPGGVLAGLLVAAILTAPGITAATFQLSRVSGVRPRMSAA